MKNLTLEVLSKEQRLELESEDTYSPTKILGRNMFESLRKRSEDLELGTQRDYILSTGISSFFSLLGFLLAVYLWPTRSGRAGAKRGLGISTCLFGILSICTFAYKGLLHGLSLTLSLPFLVLFPLSLLVAGVYLFIQGSRDWQRVLTDTPWDTTMRLKKTVELV
eukprot:TRINITY_DN10198_c0_g1_i9.p1 TRINITY_DN10198_c0_g1~~TRINITY_DN10198_c0_g1_i9.p1  ORF type:complete len:165 (+),score=5.27 TRINITY_DN10198_c0_g1_i9:142-636(+)